MADNIPFEVMDVSVSEFASQDSEGKQILVGVFSEVANFQKTPSTLPQWYINITLRPLERQFDYSIEFVAPNSRPIIRLSCKFKANEEPNDETRLTSSAQLPGIPFPGVGDYLVRIRNAHGDTVFRQPLSMRLGRKEPVDVEFTAIAQLNNEFIPEGRRSGASFDPEASQSF